MTFDGKNMIFLFIFISFHCEKTLNLYRINIFISKISNFGIISWKIKVQWTTHIFTQLNIIQKLNKTNKVQNSVFNQVNWFLQPYNSDVWNKRYAHFQ